MIVSEHPAIGTALDQFGDQRKGVPEFFTLFCVQLLVANNGQFGRCLKGSLYFVYGIFGFRTLNFLAYF